MGPAEVISFEEVRARKQWDTLREQLHARFDHWLETLEQQWHAPPSTLLEVTATVGCRMFLSCISKGFGGFCAWLLRL